MRTHAPLALLCSLSLIAACANSASVPTGTPAADTIIATAAGIDISMADAEEQVRGSLNKLRQDRYELIRKAVDELVIEKLIAKEAEARGITAEELIQMEIDDKVLDPTAQDVAQKYEENKARSGGRTLEQVYDVLYDDIKTRRFLERENAFHNMLKSKYEFAVNIDPPRLDVTTTADAFSRGSGDAPVTIVEFADFQCQYCKRVHPTLERLLTEFGPDKVRYVFQDYPLANHRRAIPASEAARCAGEQSMYWQYFEHLMVMRGDLSDDDLIRRAEEVGLDVDAFRSCYDAKRHTASVQEAIKHGQQLGVTGTPTFFINGIMMVGAKPYTELKNVIEEELRRLGATTEAEVDG